MIQSKCNFVSRPVVLAVASFHTGMARERHLAAMAVLRVVLKETLPHRLVRFEFRDDGLIKLVQFHRRIELSLLGEWLQRQRRMNLRVVIREIEYKL